jgi:hypothetical protein
VVATTDFFYVVAVAAAAVNDVDVIDAGAFDNAAAVEASAVDVAPVLVKPLRLLSQLLFMTQLLSKPLQ